MYHHPETEPIKPWHDVHGLYPTCIGLMCPHVGTKGGREKPMQIMEPLHTKSLSIPLSHAVPRVHCEACPRHPPLLSDYPSLKSLFSNSHFFQRTHQSSLSRHIASQLPFSPLTFLFIPPCKIPKASIHTYLVFSLLPYRSSHGCKATHEALHVPLIGLGLKGGYKPIPTE